MATSNVVKVESFKDNFDDLLTCTICLETFKEPKYLPCLHTFCEACIHTYINSTNNEEKSTGFKCPVCRRIVSIVDNAENSETWAKQLPLNHLIMSMIDRKAMKTSEKLCDVCSFRNISQNAVSFCTVCEEAYCESCELHHKAYKITRNHKIFPIKDINSDNSALKFFGAITCDEHPDERIKIYCKDHSKPCCTICATVHHRKCTEVVTIDKAVSGVKESTKARDLMSKLKNLSDKSCKVIQNRKQNITTFESEIEDIQKEIGNLREKLNRHLDKIEQQLKDEIKNTRKSNVLKLNDEITVLSTLNSTFENWKNIFEACLSQGSELQCLVTMEHILSKLPQLEEDMSKEAKKIRVISVKIDARNIIEKVDTLGTLSLKERRPTIPGIKTIDLHKGKIKVIFKIDINGGCISGTFFNDDIIITHYNSKTIVSHDPNGQKKRELKIVDKPTDITKVNDKTIAVSSYPHTIFEINVETMTLLKTLTVGVNVWGLCFTGDEYITAQGNTISWLNSETGAKRKCCNKDLNTPFVTCYKSTKYIYTNGNNSIRQESTTEKCFDYKSESLIGTYIQAIDYDGNVYAVGQESKNIHQITSTGELVRIIPLSEIDNLNTLNGHLWVMRFQEESNRFLLTFDSGGSVHVCKIE
ncbi:E3 ubiquitin-protein ligase TRIM45-like [Mytilus galloprovincialis]|uniref:E3 ubiquitin-protein ligase TRIM45-like n=1 Tax=Mytilus galloprovincialis TaxID=29158 RepID=UPI003F7C4858